MRTIVCDLRGVAADCATIDALARLQLAARRIGIELNVRNASHELAELLAFTGLSGALGLEPGREREEREEPLRGEEEGQLDDLSA
jgi:anti-anti-sigma regulatory factor